MPCAVLPLTCQYDLALSDVSLASFVATGTTILLLLPILDALVRAPKLPSERSG
jgi:hypothetical protein